MSFYLSIYSFGYACGFFNDANNPNKLSQNFDLKQFIEFVKGQNIRGIEIPVDRYFHGSKLENLDQFLVNLSKNNLSITMDLEEFDPNYIKEIMPIIKKHGTSFLRAKVSSFYGGNRHKSEIYKKDLSRFRKSMFELKDFLKKNDLRILVENHQDIDCYDLDNLLNNFDSKIFGVNWDIGNSLPTGLTPEDFLHRYYKRIGNIHLKDYKLSKTKKGYLMRRCQIGAGVVDFKAIFTFLSHKGISCPMSIELGAYNDREAEINNSEYWDHCLSISAKERENLVTFIDQKSKSLDSLAKNLSPSEFCDREIMDIRSSIAFIRSISV